MVEFGCNRCDARIVCLTHTPFSWLQLFVFSFLIKFMLFLCHNFVLFLWFNSFSINHELKLLVTADPDVCNRQVFMCAVRYPGFGGFVICLCLLFCWFQEAICGFSHPFCFEWRFMIFEYLLLLLFRAYRKKKRASPVPVKAILFFLLLFEIEDF